MSQKVENGKKVKAHTIYKTKDGRRVPGVTTILNVLAKPALLYWAWDLGTRGIDFRIFRDDKADIGSLAHEMILAHLKGEEVDVSEYTPKQVDLAENSFLKYLDWEKNHTVDPILLETPLVSENYGYGGTPDNFCFLDGVPTLLDYKTSKGIYIEMYYQLAAYENLIVEETGDKPKKAKIIRVGRDEIEGFEESPEIYDLMLYFEVFKNCLGIYNLQKKLKK
jgi:hypothetical protein